MPTVTGSQILARSLKRHGLDTLFYIMGGPMLAAETACIEEGIRAIDVRHEQAAAMMAHAYSRILNKPGLCMAASGPGVANLVTGVANAWVDCAPLIAIGGSSPISLWGRGAFQEIDQVAMMKPFTKWSDRCVDVRRIPEYVDTAVRYSMSGRPGPVYLDMPGDVLYARIEDDQVNYFDSPRARGRPAGDAELVRAAVSLLRQAERPIVVSGSGIFWSDATDALRTLVERLCLPFYATPQGRGAVADDHPFSYPAARSTAFREADLALVVGTRLNYVIGHLSPPRFSAEAKVIQVDIDPTEIGHNRPVEIGIVGDARAVLEQLSETAGDAADANRYAAWRDRLAQLEADKRQTSEAALSTDQVPIHPLRLCKEIRDFLDRDAILVVDGQEILNYGRQAIPTFIPRHRLNSGPFGIMGVGLPFGIGAKLAKPEAQVLVLHGDGSFGLNAMELDTAVRFNVPVVTVISLNGGWSADPRREKPGRDLGYTAFHTIAEALGCHGELVEQPADIRPALERAFASGRPAVINVVTDWRAQATTARFTDYVT